MKCRLHYTIHIPSAHKAHPTAVAQSTHSLNAWGGGGQGHYPLRKTSSIGACTSPHILTPTRKRPPGRRAQDLHSEQETARNLYTSKRYTQGPEPTRGSSISQRATPTATRILRPRDTTGNRACSLRRTPCDMVDTTDRQEKKEEENIDTLPNVGRTQQRN